MKTTIKAITFGALMAAAFFAGSAARAENSTAHAAATKVVQLPTVTVTAHRNAVTAQTVRVLETVVVVAKRDAVNGAMLANKATVGANTKA